MSSFPRGRLPTCVVRISRTETPVAFCRQYIQICRNRPPASTGRADEAQPAGVRGKDEHGERHQRTDRPHREAGARACDPAGHPSDPPPAVHVRLLHRQVAVQRGGRPVLPTTARSGSWAASTRARPAFAACTSSASRRSSLRGTTARATAGCSITRSCRWSSTSRPTGTRAQVRGRSMMQAGLHETAEGRQRAWWEGWHLRERLRARGRRVEDQGTALFPVLARQLRGRVGEDADRLHPDGEEALPGGPARTRTS